MSKKIVFVDNRVKYVLSHRIPWLQGAREAGFDVHVTTLTAGNHVRIEEAGFTYHRISEQRRSDNPLQELRLIGRLYQLYRDLNPDIIHHITLRSILYGGVASALLRKARIVNGVTGLGYLFSSQDLTVRALRAGVLGALRVLTCREHVFLFQNPDDKALFQRHNIVDPSSSVLIKGSGVDMNRFVHQFEPSGHPVVLFPARMLWHKGVQAFVDAARIIHAEGLTARFVMVGDTDDDNPAGVSAKQLEAWEAEDVIEWWGYQDHMPDVFAQSHVVCLPSAYREGVPKVLIEAASCGRPIVTTDMPGCREIVRDGENGYLVPPRDGKAVAEALMPLLQEDELRSTMGQRGRELVEREFSIEQVVRSTLEVYENVMRKSGAAVSAPTSNANEYINT